MKESNIWSKFQDDPSRTEIKNGSHTQQLVAFDDKNKPRNKIQTWTQDEVFFLNELN